MNKSNPAERLFLGDGAAELLMEHTIDDLNKKLDTKELIEISEVQLRRIFALEGLNVGNWDKAFLKGDTGTAAGFGQPTAEADNSVGQPSVEIIKSGPPTETVFHFIFKNIKGEKGDQGVKGDMPPVGVPGGAASLGADGKVPLTQLPPLDYVPMVTRAVANGVATLGADGTVPLNQLPPLNYIPTSQRGNANGVASLDSTGKVPRAQVPDIFHVGPSAPSDTKMIWIDSANKNILKFYNGSAWTTIGSVWS